ncbi:MAG: peptidylprolyl isomerase, partial [Chloroflexota bacterium]
HLGQIGRGSLVPELETYVFAMKAGETCPIPVPSRYGWHVVSVLDRADGRALPYESVKTRIADYLTEERSLGRERDIMCLQCGYVLRPQELAVLRTVPAPARVSRQPIRRTNPLTRAA